VGTFAVIALRGRIRGERDLRLALRASWAFLLLGLGTGMGMIARGTVLYRTVSPDGACTTLTSINGGTQGGRSFRVLCVEGPPDPRGH
jgi:hypothetical protein